MNSDLPKRPRLADGLLLIHGPGDAVQLRGIHPPVRLGGELARRILPLLNGRNAVSQIFRRLKDWSEEEVAGALQALAARGLLDDGPPMAAGSADEQYTKSRLAFYRGAGSGSPALILERLAAARVQVVGREPLLGKVAAQLGEAGCSPIITPLPPRSVSAEAMLGLVREPGRDLLILSLPRPEPSLAAALNRFALETGYTYLPAIVDGPEAIIGPAVLPGRSACYTCFRGRQLANLPFPEEEAAYQDALDAAAGTGLVPHWPPFTALVTGLVTMEAVRLLTGLAAPTTLGHACFLNALHGLQRTARVWKVPRCPDCGGRTPPREEAAGDAPWTP